MSLIYIYIYIYKRGKFPRGACPQTPQIFACWLCFTRCYVHIVSVISIPYKLTNFLTILHICQEIFLTVKKNYFEHCNMSSYVMGKGVLVNHSTAHLMTLKFSFQVLAHSNNLLKSCWKLGAWWYLLCYFDTEFCKANDGLQRRILYFVMSFICNNKTACILLTISTSNTILLTISTINTILLTISTINTILLTISTINTILLTINTILLTISTINTILLTISTINTIYCKIQSHSN